MSKLAFLTLTAAACCSLFRAADGAGTGGGEPANKVNPLNDPTGTAGTKVSPSKHRVVVILETTGDPEKTAREAVQLLEGDGTKILSATLQSSGTADRDLTQERPTGGAGALAANTIQGEEQTGKTPGRETLGKSPVVPPPTNPDGQPAGRIGEAGEPGEQGQPGSTVTGAANDASRDANTGARNPGDGQ